MRSARTIFVNRFYWPDETATAQLLTDLTQALAARGYDVTVITARGRTRSLSRREANGGVSIYRVRTTAFGRHNLLGRMIDFITFYAGAFWQLLWTAGPGDTVIAMTDPPMLGVIAWFATRLRRAKLIHWTQDIYPEIVVELTGRRALMVMRPLRDFVWRRATACVVPGDQMAAAILAAGVAPDNVMVVPNWAPLGLETADETRVAELREQWQVTGKFVVMYSGNLGRVHDLNPIVSVATLLRNDPGFVFVFVGGGASLHSVEVAARERALSNIRFLPARSREALGASLRAADVHFVTLRRGMERWVFPSKLYGIAQVGRPVFFIGAKDAEIARCIRSAGLGATFESADTAEIARALHSLRSDAARRRELAAAAPVFAERGFEKAADRWIQVLGPGLAVKSQPL